MLAASGGGGEGRLEGAAQLKLQQQQQQQQQGEKATVNAAVGNSTTPQRHSNHTAFSIWAVPAPAAAAAAGSSAAAPRAPPQLQQLANQLLHHPRTAATGSSSGSSSSSGVFSRVLSEGEWLRCAERVWDAVQDSRELLQYYRAVAEGTLVGAGGWSATGGRFRQQVVSADAW